MCYYSDKVNMPHTLRTQRMKVVENLFRFNIFANAMTTDQSLSNSQGINQLTDLYMEESKIFNRFQFFFLVDSAMLLIIRVLQVLYETIF